MKDRKALEAYRQSRAAEKANQEKKESPTGSQPVIRPPAPPPSEPDPAGVIAMNAAKHIDEWIAEDNIAALVSNYGLLSNPHKRQTVLTWAVEKARGGNIEPLLAIGIEDVEPAVQKRLDSMLASLPGDLLLSRISGHRFTVKERRTVAGLLGRCKDPEAGRLLETMTKHHDSRVRESALQALAYYPVTRNLQLPIFKHFVERDPNQFVRLRAAEGLARLGGSEALGALELAARKDSASAEMKAVWAGVQAQLRHGHYEEPETQPSGAKGKPVERKPFPWRNVGALVIVALILCFAGYRLSPPLQRWYRRTFPPPPATEQPPPPPVPVR